MQLQIRSVFVFGNVKDTAVSSMVVVTIYPGEMPVVSFEVESLQKARKD